MKREIIWTWAAEMDAQEAFMQLEDRASGSGLHLVALTERLLGRAAIQIG